MSKILVAENFWGPITTEQASSLSVFECGHCSLPEQQIQIYHNILGQHKHISNENLEKILNEHPEAIVG